VVLQADSAGKVESIGNTVARGSDGRFYTSVSQSGQVTVWNPDGTFRRNFGAPGQGPGEFDRGPKTILFDRGGRLLVSDNRRLSIFTPAYDFVSTIPSLRVPSRNAAVILADGNFLTTVGERGASFSIYNLNQSTAGPPPLVRAFGPSVSNGFSARPLVYSGGTTFWAGPPNGPGFGYVLELWRTDGTRVRTIRRDVPWMPNASDVREGGRMPPPEMELIHEDGSGIIIVGMMVPNKTFLTLSPADMRSEALDGPMNAAIDIYIEAIDANAGVMLASIGPIRPSEAIRVMPIGFFPATRQGYRREEDANGLPLMRMVEFQLVAR
jgi:hypothetical protein